MCSVAEMKPADRRRRVITRREPQNVLREPEDILDVTWGLYERVDDGDIRHSHHRTKQHAHEHQVTVVQLAQQAQVAAAASEKTAATLASACIRPGQPPLV